MASGQPSGRPSQSSVVSRRAATSTSGTPSTRQGCGLSSRPAYEIADDPEQRRRAAEDFFCHELEAWRKAMGIERMVCPEPKPKPKPNPKPRPRPNPKPNPRPNPRPNLRPNPSPSPSPSPNPNPNPNPHPHQVLAGHSIGGHSAFAYAERHPERVDRRVP